MVDRPVPIPVHRPFLSKPLRSSSFYCPLGVVLFIELCSNIIQKVKVRETMCWTTSLVTLTFWWKSLSPSYNLQKADNVIFLVAVSRIVLDQFCHVLNGEVNQIRINESWDVWYFRRIFHRLMLEETLDMYRITCVITMTHVRKKMSLDRDLQINRSITSLVIMLQNDEKKWNQQTIFNLEVCEKLVDLQVVTVNSSLVWWIS